MKKTILILTAIASLVAIGVCTGMATYTPGPPKHVLFNMSYNGYTSVVYIKGKDTLSLDGLSRAQYDSIKNLTR